MSFDFNSLSSPHKGIIMVAVVVTTVIISLLIVTSINSAYSNYRLAHHVITGTKAFYLAEAGIKRAIYKIENDEFGTELWSFAGEDVNITIASVEVDVYQVSSSANYGSLGRNKTINARIRKGADTQLIEWQLLN